MARPNNASASPQRWSNAKLIAEVRRVSSLADFGTTQKLHAKDDASEFVRQSTALYRATWLEPLLAELERRLIKAEAV